MPHDERLALTNLKKDEKIVIAQADKTKEVVVLNKDDYYKKVDDHISDNNTYEKLSNNPQKTL